MPETPPPDTSMSPDVEGRLLAQRRVLVALMAELPDDRRRALLAWLVERSAYQDGHEDPGAVPVEGLAMEYALADEFRHLGRLLEARLQELARTPPEGETAG